MTAMQELYEALHNTHPSQWNDVIMNDKSRLLTKEREQIVEARLSVTGLNHASPTDDNSLEEAEQYYSSKYSVPTT